MFATPEPADAEAVLHCPQLDMFDRDLRAIIQRPRVPSNHGSFDTIDQATCHHLQNYIFLWLT